MRCHEPFQFQLDGICICDVGDVRFVVNQLYAIVEFTMPPFFLRLWFPDTPRRESLQTFLKRPLPQAITVKAILDRDPILLLLVRMLSKGDGQQDVVIILDRLLCPFFTRAKILDEQPDIEDHVLTEVETHWSVYIEQGGKLKYVLTPEREIEL